MEQKKVDESVLRLAEEQKKILLAEGERNSPSEEHGAAKETRLKASAGVGDRTSHRGYASKETHGKGRGQDVKKILEEIEESLNEKKELEDFDALNQALVIKEQKANVELKDARKELIDGMKQYSSRALIGVKRMGELDSKIFQEITKRKFLGKDADLKAAQLCSNWEHYIKDPNWYPFKDVASEDGSKEIIIDDSDERLNELKHEFGEAAYELVTTALMEMDEGPSSSRCITTELWNYRQGRTATLNEGITYALQKLKASKAKKR